MCCRRRYTRTQEHKGTYLTKSRVAIRPGFLRFVLVLSTLDLFSSNSLFIKIPNLVSPTVSKTQNEESVSYFKVKRRQTKRYLLPRRSITKAHSETPSRVAPVLPARNKFPRKRSSYDRHATPRSFPRQECAGNPTPALFRSQTL